MKIYSPFEGGFSRELPMPARKTQQEDEKGMMEAACPQPSDQVW
jgi:hypothetical protein